MRNDDNLIQSILRRHFRGIDSFVELHWPHSIPFLFGIVVFVVYWKSLPIVLRTSIGARLGEFCLKYLKGSCSPFLMELKLNNTMIVTTMEVMAIKKSLECQKRFTKAYPMALIGSWCPLLVSIVIGVAVALASLSSLFESACSKWICVFCIMSRILNQIRFWTKTLFIDLTLTTVLHRSE